MVKLKVVIDIRNVGVYEYKKKKNTSKGFPLIRFTKVVKLPIEPKDGDRINVKPGGFKWSGKTITPIKNDYPQEEPFFEAIDTSMTLTEDKSSLKESLLYLINAYKENGWEGDVPEIWQEIIDKEND